MMNTYQRMGQKCLAFILILAIGFTTLPAVERAEAATPNIGAKAALSMDFDSGEILYAKDIDTPRPVASLTKMMTTYLIYEGVRDGRWNWDTQVPISEANRKYAANDPCGAKIHLNQTESLHDITRLTLIISSNACARILAEFAAGTEANFVQQMNQRAAALGLQARYGDAAGLKWNAVTPRANALLARRFMQEFPEVVKHTCRNHAKMHGRTFYNVNLLYTRVPTPGADGFKSGWMPFSGFCFVGTARRGDRRVITVVLNSPRYQQSYEETRVLINDAFTRLPAKPTTPVVPETDKADKPSVAVPTEQVPEKEPVEKPERNERPEKTEVGSTTSRPMAPPPYYPTSHWAQKSVDEATAAGLSCQKERGASAFCGQEAVSRAEFVAILMKALATKTEKPKAQHFTDVAEDIWYAPYVENARLYGVTDGISEDRFGPDLPVTREQMAALIGKALMLSDSESDQGFVDQHLITPNMRGAVATIVAHKLMVGHKNGNFGPKEKTSREQATIIVYRLLRQIQGGQLKNPLSQSKLEASKDAEKKDDHPSLGETKEEKTNSSLALDKNQGDQSSKKTVSAEVKMETSIVAKDMD